ncbi:uncharacterized protein METZ01_LOCUS354849 [marine metagenome]|uniref:Uncharacterized protein n=1 Tax=marine metagenome TaxID=408172 RepID=A0A382RXU6_9ZZZZ
MLQNAVALVREIHYGLMCQFFDFKSFVSRFTAVNGSELICKNMHSKNIRAWFERGRKGNFFKFEQAGVSIFITLLVLRPPATNCGYALP